MNTVEIDFHYYLVEDALRVAEGIVNSSRLNNEPVQCFFITGRGKIQKELMTLFKELYQLDPVIPMHNTGMVIVYVY